MHNINTSGGGGVTNTTPKKVKQKHESKVTTVKSGPTCPNPQLVVNPPWGRRRPGVRGLHAADSAVL